MIDTTPTTSADPPKKQRDLGLDAGRGIAILAVVAIHCTGHFASIQSMSGGAYFCYGILNKLLQFAVPCFLMASAYLIAKRASRPETRLLPDMLGRYRRLVPLYLAWSVVGLSATFGLPPHGLTPRHAAHLIWDGKAYYHLYFLVLFFEMIPLATLLGRYMGRLRSGWALAALTAVLQGIVYALNQQQALGVNLNNGILWYLPAVAAGAWFGTRSLAPQTVARHRMVYAGTAAVGLWIYLPLALLAWAGYALNALPLRIGPFTGAAHSMMLGLPVNTFGYQVGLWLWSLGASVLLLFSARWGTGMAARSLALLGQRSFAIYAAHPFVLYVLDRVPGLHHGPVALRTLFTFAMCVAVPLGVSVAAGRLKLRRST